MGRYPPLPLPPPPPLPPPLPPQPMNPWNALAMPWMWHGVPPTENIRAEWHAHTLAMQRNGTESCPRVQLTLNQTVSSFFLCTPPGAVTIKFMSAGDERVITRRMVATVLYEGGWERRPRVVDIGMNDGLLTLAAAANGARVIAYDIAPSCFPFVSTSIARSSLLQSVTLRNMGLSNSTQSLSVQTTTCNPIGMLEQSSAKRGPVRKVPVRTMDDELLPLVQSGHGEISMLKIDAEGAEIRIFAGGLKAIGTGRIRQIIVEVNTRYWPRLFTTLDEGKQTIRSVVAAGNYTMYVFLNKYERLGPCLDRTRTNLAYIGLMSEVLDIDCFLDDREQKRIGCNMLLVQSGYEKRVFIAAPGYGVHSKRPRSPSSPSPMADKPHVLHSPTHAPLPLLPPPPPLPSNASGRSCSRDRTTHHHQDSHVETSEAAMICLSPDGSGQLQLLKPRPPYGRCPKGAFGFMPTRATTAALMAARAPGSCPDKPGLHLSTGPKSFLGMCMLLGRSVEQCCPEAMLTEWDRSGEGQLNVSE